jgi:hypothetical protein
MTTASPVRGIKSETPAEAQKRCWGGP